MAVLSKIPGVSVEVRIAGEKAKEYDDPDAHASMPSDIPASSHYIESRSGAPFSIHFQVTDKYKKRDSETIVVFYVYIDDDFIGGKCLTLPTPNALPMNETVESTYSYSRESGDTKEHELVFIHVESGSCMIL